MRRIMVFLCVAAAFALAATAGTARAGGGLLSGLLGGNCGAVAPVFAQWSDSSDYYLPSNGGFENGTANWSLSGPAAVVGNNDPFALSGNGSHSLALSAGGSASITVCYGLTFPALRFVAAGVNGPARIHVRVQAKNLLGLVSILDGGTFTVQQGWDASPKVSTLLSALVAPLGTKSMSVQISVDSGSAEIDDLYIDPFLTKG
jgi:hypothetical protein